jgi:hypothetical protein
MITISSLEKAAAQNIISTEQDEPLYQFLRAQASDSQIDSREEPLRFIRSFGDIFITLGVILLLMSINASSISGMYYLLPVAGFVLIAEWLVRVRRLALPGMAILLSILFLMYKAIPFDGDNTLFYVFGVLALTSLAFYLRYKMPFSLLPLAASVVTMIIVQLDISVLDYPIIFSGLGLIVFAVALWFDTQDTQRQSHLSDSAFWLHLLASPLIVHGMMVTILLSQQAWVEMLSKELLMIVFFAVFFLLALFLDRRAMLISTQIYVIYSLTQLFKNNLTGTQDVIIYVLLALGLFVLYFGAYWYKSRRFIFKALAGHAITRFVPDLNIEDVKR